MFSLYRHTVYRFRLSERRSDQIEPEVNRAPVVPELLLYLFLYIWLFSWNLSRNTLLIEIVLEKWDQSQSRCCPLFLSVHKSQQIYYTHVCFCSVSHRLFCLCLRDNKLETRRGARADSGRTGACAEKRVCSPNKTSPPSDTGHEQHGVNPDTCCWFGAGAFPAPVSHQTLPRNRECATWRLLSS